MSDPISAPSHPKPLCIVTGGSFGIGAAVCETFNTKGYQVVNLDIQCNPQQADEIHWVDCDMSVIQKVSDAIKGVINQYGRVDCLVSNAGMHYSGTIEDTSELAFEKVFNLNVKGAIAATQAVLPYMKAQQAGVILYMASDQALIAKPNSFAYNLSKAALASMARTTAIDYASYQIRANAICPGTIETPLYHHAIERYVAKSGADNNKIHCEEAALQP